MLFVGLFPLFFVPLQDVQAQEQKAPSVQRQAELLHLLKQDCGSCHGLYMTGGLGTPLTVQALAGKPRDSLAATILDGRNGTAMPPWQGILNEADANWLVDYLQKGEPSMKENPLKRNDP